MTNGNSYCHLVFPFVEALNDQDLNATNFPGRCLTGVAGVPFTRERQ